MTRQSEDSSCELILFILLCFTVVPGLAMLLTITSSLAGTSHTLHAVLPEQPFMQAITNYNT